ncbi:MAG: ester cyclase [Pseudomonadota bacterium]
MRNESAPTQRDLDTLKDLLLKLLHRLCDDGNAAAAYSPDAQWHGYHPFNERTGAEEITGVWAALRDAFSGLTRTDEIAVCSENAPDPRLTGPRPKRMLATMGHYTGRFDAPFLGLSPTGQQVKLRACEAHALDDRSGLIGESWVIVDILDFLRQIGRWPTVPSLGREGAWCAPPTNAVGPSAGSLERVLAMHAALGKFDGRSLESMPHAQYWSEDFAWYGPAGIGTTRGLAEFRAHHQIPFLIGFPDRLGSGHYMRLEDGPLAVTGGWPSVTGTHLGPWLGMPGTGKRVEMRVMDFYRLGAGGLIEENWVPIDILHMALQMGVDVLDRACHLDGHPRTEL